MYPDAAADGLYILPEDAPVGESAVSYLGLDDVVVEYEITSNRVDCFAILGSCTSRQQLLSEKSLFRR